MTSPITRKLRNRIKTINKDDNITKQIMEFALEGNVDPLKGDEVLWYGYERNTLHIHPTNLFVPCLFGKGYQKANGANAMVASVVDDSDPEPANTTDIEDLSTIAGAIQQSKQHLDQVRSADTDEKACYAVPLLVASIYKVNEMITKWDADLSSAVLQFNA